MATFQYVQVELSRCFVDVAFQRDLNETRASKMAEEHNDLYVGTCEGSVRSDGRVSVIVGQHRVDSARKRGEETIWMKLWSGLTREQESDIFSTQAETEESLSLLDLHKSNVFGRDPRALAIQACLDRSGHRFARRGLDQWCVTAPSAVYEVYERYGEAALVNSLLLFKSWTTGKGIRANVIRGAGIFFYLVHATGDTVSVKRLVDALGSDTHQDIARLAREECLSGNGWAMDRAIAQVLRSKYNKAGSSKLRVFRPRSKAA